MKSPHGQYRLAILLLLPASLIYAAFVITPVIESFVISFFRWDGYSVSMRFVGLDNFRELVGDAVFWKALYHNFLLVVLSLVIQLPIALVLAAILTGRVWARGLWRTVYFAPMILPTAAIGIIWGYVYHPVDGLLNQALRGLGLDTLCRGWLGESETALLAIVVVISWRFIGFHMVLLMAGMETIPESLYEAARIDGASAWRNFVHITLPLCRPFLRISVVLSIVGSLKYFDLVYIMTEGGPPDHATELVSTYMFKEGIGADRWGYGSALATALFLVTMAVSVAFLATSSRKEPSC